MRQNPFWNAAKTLSSWSQVANWSESLTKFMSQLLSSSKDDRRQRSGLCPIVTTQLFFGAHVIESSCFDLTFFACFLPTSRHRDEALKRALFQDYKKSRLAFRCTFPKLLFFPSIQNPVFLLFVFSISFFFWLTVLQPWNGSLILEPFSKLKAIWWKLHFKEWD